MFLIKFFPMEFFSESEMVSLGAFNVYRIYMCQSQRIE